MTGTFLQPDHETQSGSIYKAAIDNSFAVLARIGQMFAPHEQATPNMTVRLDAGALLANVTLSEIAAQSTGTITAPTGSDHRIDRVVIDATTGVASVITGTPGGSPVAPAITTGKLPICQVALAHGMTVITNDLITDERVMGAGGGEAFPINGIYTNLGADPATELGYGTWSLLGLNGPQYPPAYSDVYVKATTSGGVYPYNATDPSNPLTGIWDTSWFSLLGYLTNQCFHIDLGSRKAIDYIYYENLHYNGLYTNKGAKNFTYWGSDDPAAFAELTYAINTGWSQLTTTPTAFEQHVAADQADPKYIVVTTPAFYRYRRFKFADNWGGASFLGFRRLVLQIRKTEWLRTA